MQKKIAPDVSKRIQIVRAICIFMTCMVHCASFTTYETVWMPLCHGCVGVFIFLSGYLTTYEERWWCVGKRRFLRVFFPYIIWSIIYMLLEKNYSSFFWKLLTGQGCSVYYYIIVYMELILLTPLLLKLVSSKWWRLGYLITPLYMCFIYVMAFHGRIVMYPYNINHFAAWLIFYYLGLRVRYREDNGKPLEKKLSAKVLIALTAFCLIVEETEALYWIRFGREDLAGTQVKMSAMCTCLILCLLAYVYVTRSRTLRENRGVCALIHVGDASFGIYLTHLLLIDVLVRVFAWDAISVLVRTLLVAVSTYIFVSILRKLCREKWGKIIGVF